MNTQITNQISNQIVNEISIEIINEVWRSVDEYLNYQISNIGRVRTCNTGKILKATLEKTGYLRIGLTNHEGLKKKLIHRLVAHEFIHNPENKPCVDHINNEKQIIAF